MDKKLKEYLDVTAERFNTPAFIPHDPVQFPRQFSRLEDIEIMAILASHIAWGHRTMICNNCRRLIDWMQNEPHRWLMEEEYESLTDRQCVHRTFFGASLKHMARGLRAIYKEYGTMQNFAHTIKMGEQKFPSWYLTEKLNAVLAQANDGRVDSFCFPSDMHKTALKRINMALRWLVRCDGIVDMGVWDVIKPSQLFIPLDVHVADTGRQLGLIKMSSNDKYAVIHLTNALREMRPEDPCYYDFALFGLGVEQGCREGRRGKKQLLADFTPSLFNMQSFQDGE